MPLLSWYMVPVDFRFTSLILCIILGWESNTIWWEVLSVQALPSLCDPHGACISKTPHSTAWLFELVFSVSPRIERLLLGAENILHRKNRAPGPGIHTLRPISRDLGTLAGSRRTVGFFTKVFIWRTRYSSSALPASLLNRNSIKYSQRALK